MIEKIILKVENLDIFTQMTRCEILVFNEIVRMTETEGNYKGVAILNGTIRKDIAVKLNIRNSSLSNALNILCKKGIVARVDINMYKVNEDLVTLK